MSPSRTDDPEVTRRREAFVDDACAALGIEREVIAEVTPDLLRLVGKVAHGAARPAGPLAALLVGIAATGPTPDAAQLRERMGRVAAALDGWQG